MSIKRTAIPTKPKLLHDITIRRRPYFRRFVWSAPAIVAAAGALLALNMAAERGAIDNTLWSIGVLAGLLVILLFGLRGFINLWRGLRSRDERLRLYDKGLVWERGGDEQKYGWSQIDTYRDTTGGLYLGKRRLLQWGAHILTMQDGRAFKLTGAYGDLRRLGNIVRRPVAHFTGIRMGQALRDEQPIKLHPKLTIWPGGLQVGKQDVHWSDVDVRLKNRRLTILRKNKKGLFRTLRRYNAGTVNNLGGFLEIADATIRTHQRERFQRRPAVGS